MLVTGFGEGAWRCVLARAGVDLDGFLLHEGYPDEITYAIVAAASQELGRPAEELLERFGEYWITYTAAQGYGEMLELAGRTLEEFLANLDQMHARVALILPGLETPSFRLESALDGALLLQYSSRRPGLAPMVVGLIRGLGRRFGEPVEVSFDAEAERESVLFRIVRRGRRAA